jgi:hypothetical protein
MNGIPKALGDHWNIFLGDGVLSERGAAYFLEQFS